MRTRILMALLVVLALASSSRIAHAQQRWAVPHDATTIQAAIDSADAGAGDYVAIEQPPPLEEGESYDPFTLNKAIDVVSESSSPIIVSGAGQGYAARITASGGVIEGLTLRGGSQYVVDVGPGTVRDCRIEDVSGSLAYDYAVKLSASGGLMEDSQVIRTTGARAVDITAAATLSHCTIEVQGTSSNDHAAVRVNYGSATLDGNTITFASGLSHPHFGIELTDNGGDATITHNLIDRANRGIYVLHSSTGNAVFRYNIFKNCGAGLWFDAGSSETIEYNTVIRDESCSGTYGFRFNSAVTQTAVNNNLFHNVGTGIVCGSGNMSYSHNVFSAGPCGGGTPSSCTLSASQLATKECLFCEGREGEVEAYTQRIDSQAAPKNNGWDEQVGAKDVECAWGTLSRSTTVAYDKQITVLEDLIVPGDKSLTLQAGSALKFDGDDESGDGNDSEKNELSVAGTLSASGSASYPVRFVSLSADPAEGDWYGIDARYASSLTLSRAEVRHAVYGVIPKMDSGTCSITNSTFGSNENYDLYAVQAGSAAPTITGNTISVGGGTGIYLYGNFSNATVSGNSLTGNSLSTAGIYAAGGSPSLTGNTVSSVGVGDGIWLASGSPTLTTNTVTNCLNGLHVTGGSPSIGTTSSSSDNAVYYNLYGLHVEATGCSFGPVTVRNNWLGGNTHTGVLIDGTNNVDLGTAQQSGNNSIAYNTWWEIYNNSNCGTVPARGNYFGECQDPPEPIRTTGAVDVTGFLCAEPAGLEVAVEPAAPGAPLTVRGIWPNPVRGAATLGLTLGRPARAVTMEVFDVSGRLVNRTIEADRPAGELELSWDGADRSGRPVPAGLYFVRVTVDDLHRASVKALVVR